ncbi:MAG: hypothetical protein Q7R99_02670 [bacterium]|nr:hypothetical protein [bacterium]
MAEEQNTNQPQATEQKPVPETPIEPPQKISLAWVFIGIAGILLMWFISSRVF